MNGKDIFDALSGIDPKYIDEAAYELSGEASGTSDTPAKVVDITKVNSKRRIKRFVKVALPSVAAILLIVGVALPAILRVSKSSSSAMSDAAAPAPMAEAQATGAQEAAAEEPMAEAAAEAEADEAVAEAPAEAAETAEAPAAEEAAPEAATYDRDTMTPDEQLNFKRDEAKNTEATAEAEEAAPSEPWVIKEAQFDRNILVIRCGGSIPADITELPFTLERTDVPADKAKVAAGRKLSELSDRIDVTDNYIVINFMDTDLKFEKGKYRLIMGDTEAEFEVK